MDTEYEPDVDAFEDLVDSDGRQPTHAQLTQAALEPVDALEVIAAIESAVDLAENFLIAGTGTPEERLRLLVLLMDMTGTKGAMTHLRRLVEARLVGDLDAPMFVAGRWWRAGRRKRTTGWDKPALRSAVNRFAMSPTDEGPPTPQEVVERMWKLVDVATGRSKQLRELADVDADEYAAVEWSDCIELDVDQHGV